MQLADSLSAMLPSQVRVAVADDVPNGFRLLAGELPAVAKMSQTRRSEFTVGRYCARAALAELGTTGQAVPMATSREPHWPAGIVGSISHTGRLAAAAVARARDVPALGIDLESDEPLQQDLVAMICRAEERARLADEFEPRRAAKIIFSAKESFYKCVWPRVRHFVDFHDVEVRLNYGAGQFTAISHSTLLPDQVLAGFQGRFCSSDDVLVTSAFIPGA